MTSVPITIELSANLVDNPYPRETKTIVEIVNSQNRLIEVSSATIGEADIHIFSIPNSLDIGYPVGVNIPEDVCDLLSVALSLSNDTVMFARYTMSALSYEEISKV